MGVIISAVFWLLGLLMAWSMCVVAERADRRMEVVVLYAQWTDAMTTMPETGGTMNEHYLLKTIGGGAASSASSSSHSRGGARAEAGSINRKGGVTC